MVFGAGEGVEPDEPARVCTRNIKWAKEDNRRCLKDHDHLLTSFCGRGEPSRALVFVHCLPGWGFEGVPAQLAGAGVWA